LRNLYRLQTRRARPHVSTTPEVKDSYAGNRRLGTALDISEPQEEPAASYELGAARQEADMVTNYPQALASTGRLITAEESATVKASSPRMMDLLRQMFCALHGHDALLHFEHERISLRCVSCGHETPGWELNETPPTVTVRGDARRHAIARPKLVKQRRIA
jgi:hypothetical protein